MEQKAEQLLQSRGVRLVAPETVYIGTEVDLERISGPETVIYPGCRLMGQSLFVGPGCQIGRQGPATIIDCMLGPKVQLQGGFFQGSVFLKGAKVGPSAHVRQGTIMEEYASAAHCVGLKQTILFPWVTLGSLINFCDCLMAGGTGPEDHSEVGSSYIHFNFTPNQDKATASLIGDVPKGVMLRETPIFLGGQGGLVGPCRLAFGTVLAAGTICRKDQLSANRLVVANVGRSVNLPYNKGRYTNVGRIIKNNLIYIANLLALRQWYRKVRKLFVSDDDLPGPVFKGLVACLDYNLEQRVARLSQFATKLGAVAKGHGRDASFVQNWPKLEKELFKYDYFQGNLELKGSFMNSILQSGHLLPESYLSMIQMLDSKQSATATEWLESIIRQVLDTAQKIGIE